ncbi:ATP-dependent DNA helicase RecG [Methylothermus subterraneus]
MAAEAAFIPQVESLFGVGPALAAKLARVGIQDVRDLVLHAPLRYEDRRQITPIGAACAGRVLIEGEVALAEVVGKQRPMLVCRLWDGSGALDLRFFHYHRHLRRRLVPGSRWRCFGEVRVTPYGREMIHPELEPADQAWAQIVPVYPTTAGIAQKTWRRLIALALSRLDPTPKWLPQLPPDCLPAWAPVDLKTALVGLHQPPAEDWDGGERCRRRLAFEELLAHRLAFCSASLGCERRAPVLVAEAKLLDEFRRRLPFSLTSAQERVVAEIYADLAKDKPMGRLLQGDVGAGKTVVAALAALAAASSGWQTALMVPTEILAEQHYRLWTSWLAELGIKVALLTAHQGKSHRRAILDRVAGGEVDVLIGTHALFQREVRFLRLGLTIVDEQHRFGVDQRLALKTKAHALIPHYLVMTATPIPRTLAMLRYGDLAVSRIDELPPGRKPVETCVMSENKRAELIARLKEWIVGGRQAYWVCTLIEESEAWPGEAAEKTVETLRRQLPGIRIGLVHGRLKAEVKEKTMAAFKVGEIDLLVATTVVEVGVDVPNAGLMVIENAERLGLAQLHQLRGRVGRGGGTSYCVLLYKPPLSETARKRLAYVRDCHDGFALAEKDLELRGPGEVLGTRQSGAFQFRIADLGRDSDLVPEVNRVAERLKQHAPQTIASLLAFWLEGGGRYAEV